MNLWVMTGTYNGEHFATTHLTEKGAMRAMILDILQFLGIEGEENQRAEIGNHDQVLEWNPEVIGEMETDDLRCLLHQYSEHTWDNDQGYSLEVVRCSLEA